MYSSLKFVHGTVTNNVTLMFILQFAEEMSKIVHNYIGVSRMCYRQITRTGQTLFKLTTFNNYPLGDGLVSATGQFK